MPRLKIAYFGAFNATLDGSQLIFDTDKARALLAYLALESSHPHHRQRLAGLFWSDMPEERALHNLRQTLSVLRKTLKNDADPNAFLIIQRDSVQFNPESNSWLDAVAFDQEIQESLSHYQYCPGQENLHCRLNLRQLQRAIELFRGPFLDQLYLSGSPIFDEWSSLRREAFNQRAIEALAILADLYERRGEYARARHFASQIATLAPWDETAQVQVIRLLGIEGRWSAAQSQYHRLLSALRDQIGVAPSAETQKMFAAIRHGAAQNTPLPAPRPPTHHNLPPNASPFIGRECELEALAAALADPHCRLLTLHGPGGVGKTRLALQAANEQRGIFADGVFFIPLVSVTEADLLPNVIAEALNFRFHEGQPTLEQLLLFLDEKHMLWVLDNLEQLLPLPGHNLISQVLQRAPGIVILATSRQRLNLREEHIFPTQGLSYPQSVETPHLEHQESCQLFMRQARRIHPALDLAMVSDRQAIAGICQLLEGLPLGVELAAAALWKHTPEEILGNLQESLRNLVSESIDVSERHRSLWAAFKVSWALLSLEEQQLLAALSVFRGGFEAGIAQRLLAAPAPLLASLIDQSLLHREADGRYRIHEALRQFAAEKLAQNPAEAAAVRANHAHGFADYLAERVKPLKSFGQAQALDEIAQEWDNVRQAWRWLTTNQNSAGLAASAEAIFHFCNIRTRYQEGIGLFAQASDFPDHFAATQAKVLTFQGALAFRALDHSLCESALTRARALLENQNQPEGLALCLLFSSGLAARQKNPERAWELCQKSLNLFEQIADEWGQAYAWYQLGLLESRAGRATEAQKSLLISLEFARKVGDQRRQIGPLNLLGDLACQLGKYHEAQPYFTESLSISRVLEDHFNTAQALINLGTVFQYAGELHQARECYTESLTISREIGDLPNQSLALVNLGELALEIRQFAEAIQYLQRGSALADQVGDEWAMLICWISLSDAAVGQGDLAAAKGYLRNALPLAQRSAEPGLMLRTLLHLGRFYGLQGQSQKATDLLGLVLHHEATYDEYRQAAREALDLAGLPQPIRSELSLETVMHNEIADLKHRA